MRITSTMRQGDIIRSLNEGQEKLYEAQRKLSTTKEVAASSDNPALYDRASRLKTLLSKNEHYQENLEDGLGWARTGSDTMQVMYQTLMDIQFNGVRARGNVDQNARAIAYETVKSLIEELVDLGNVTHLGKYLFGGTVTKNTPPFEYDGSSVTYNGNDEDLSRKVGAGTYISINTVGSEFEGIYSSSISLRDAILADDGDAIEAAMGNFEVASNDLINAMASSGHRQRKMELTRDNLEMASVNLQSHITNAEDADLTEAIMRYNSQELGFRAALESSARILSLSILDHM